MDTGNPTPDGIAPTQDSLMSDVAETTEVIHHFKNLTISDQSAPVDRGFS